jgi:hypothetical protein
MSDTAKADGIAESTSNMLLLDDVIKRLGAPFACCNLVPHTPLL